MNETVAVPEFVVFLGIFAAVAVASFFGNRRRVEAWTAAAAQLGLELGEGTGPGTMRGFVHDVAVFVEVDVRGSGKNRSEWTVVRTHHGVPGAPFRLRKERLLHRFGKAFGISGNDVLIGDPEFDDAVIVDGDEAMAAFMTPARRMAALTLFETYRSAEITNDTTVVEIHGVVSDAEELVDVVSFVVDTTRIIADPSGFDDALRLQQAGDLGGAAEAMHALNEGGDGNQFGQLLELEAHVALGNGQAAQEVLDAADHLVPELEQWDGVVEALPPEPVRLEDVLVPAEPPAVAEPMASDPTPPGQTAAPHAGWSADQASVIADLFSSHRMGFETEAHFLEHYDGRQVVWSGTVDRVQTFRYDSVFDGDGTKAIVTIGELGDGRVITQEVSAVVRLHDDHGIQRGDHVTFAGTLVKVDRYMRNLYLDRAHLTEIAR